MLNSNSLLVLASCFLCNSQLIYDPGDSFVNGINDDVLLSRCESQKDNDDKDMAYTKKPYEFPPVRRLDPGHVDMEVGVNTGDGRPVHRITRATQPPVFEIPNFLSDEECDYIINKAMDTGLKTSGLFGDSIEKQLASGKQLSDIDRVSQTTWLTGDVQGKEFSDRLTRRLSALTEMPIDLIDRSEYIQVVNYGVGGHYHAHLDSSDNERLPCCFQTDCSHKANTPQWNECCRICRFVTVMYYLNDVDGGGETAFPFADLKDISSGDIYRDMSQFNLSQKCYNASLVVSPKKGTAVMWYNHHIDDKGYLGSVDMKSYHGGCDVTRGTKWIATSWLSAAPYSSRYEPSVYYNEH